MDLELGESQLWKHASERGYPLGWPQFLTFSFIGLIRALVRDSEANLKLSKIVKNYRFDETIGGARIEYASLGGLTSEVFELSIPPFKPIFRNRRGGILNFSLEKCRNMRRLAFYNEKSLQCQIICYT